MRRNRVTLLAFLLALTLSPAFADTCLFTTQAEATSRDERHTFMAHYDRDSRSWVATLKDARRAETAKGNLAGLGLHQHCRAFVSDDGTRVVIFEPSAGLGEENRVLVYDDSFELLKSFGLADLLTREERGKVTRSVSHIHRMSEQDPGRGTDAWVDKDTFAIRAVGGRIVRVGLREPKVLASAVGTDGPKDAPQERTKPIGPEEARKKVNETVTVRMEVKSSRLMETDMAYLNSDKDYRSPENFTIFMDKGAVDRFKEARIDDPAKHYQGKTIVVTGKVTLYRERPQIAIKGPNDIKVESARAEPTKAADAK
jgi:DNA/RNA endonuclease YhcR with UshA esterase domain